MVPSDSIANILVRACAAYNAMNFKFKLKKKLGLEGWHYNSSILLHIDTIDDFK